ncbi:phosphonate ABC transporter ATP-binding protein [Testudinibacter sp. TR-2022]|uniref:phosphonate ABC transporter ATP-binding protein n=1 Tax=Testudinibacter sp. TR-2022 TaxID=2585029 RepID=UPI00111A716B|nr:phosphonate ABC transporter ATP-binding protein [Testudinibacter sp. TR-2022]TNH03933.1 phosphonate ABC transporter ATP-binding protein [Pasteurellaceae bacterium Phil31]TNH07657.1 phosphonate ABC transporter ATP-binding protein [Testudinibacter sp. TR-2022]TNH09863.1 phosphonate ABC transporter ATP-binding protein [Testudinibacter sp. TR-2022]TNH17287.1 phosphonate ABC transporter ATP-binding protein [Testudinibacter sp. TR-2022]TNH18305.1 phosphonate ABC transporter ATP-binding protein [T
MSSSLLSLHNVSKRFNQKNVLDQISLNIQAGEIVALVGPSGSGKSTLMNAIMRSVELSSGAIFIEQKNIQDYRNNKAYAQKVGMLHQQYDLVKQLEVVHNVLAGRLNDWGLWQSLLSLIKPQQRHIAEQALSAVGLAEKMNQPSAELSGGEQQRVAIARLLVQNPMLILADEPISALDPVNAQNVLALLTKLVREQHKTLIASMHSVEYAKAYFDRMIGIKDGKIVFDLQTSQVTQQKLNALYGLVQDESLTE